MKEKDKIPCKDCICLSICKTQIIQEVEKRLKLNLSYTTKVKTKDALLYFSAKQVLMKKCSTFRIYIIKERHWPLPVKSYKYPRIFLILKYMELIK